MSGLQQCLRALGLFALGHFARPWLLALVSPAGGMLGCAVAVAYYLVLTALTFKYATSYRHPKLPATDFSVTVIGAAFSGIAMGVKLKELGIKFRIVEKNPHVGGTWWSNTYPGCACDVASHLYSYSFHLNPAWSESYAPQREILRYLEGVVDRFNLSPHIELGKEVQAVRWDEATKLWTVKLTSGEEFTSNVVVSAVGGLIIPNKPVFPGAETFTGRAFHSAEWPADYNPAGRKVAIVGTGASAVQILPAIADKVSQVSVFQRTPCWVPPRDLWHTPSWLISLFKVFTPLMYLFRMFYFWRAEFRFWAVFRLNSPVRKRANVMIAKHHRQVVKDKELAKKLTPTFETGCKRITPSNEYLQSYNKSNVSLVTDKIKTISEKGIHTENGGFVEADTIVYATGFTILDSMRQYKAYNTPGTEKQSTSLQEIWGDFPNAYKGITYPKYPNLFYLLGPGTGLGHNSIIFVIECQVNYIIDAIEKMVNGGIKAIDVKKEVNDSYQDWVQETLKNKVFSSSNCASWYKNSAGKIYTLWPSHLTHYWWTTREVELEDYNIHY